MEQNKTETYKGYTIKVEQYLNSATNYCYSIIDASGNKIVDTLWNDDKLWSSSDTAIASAKKDIDNPDSGYIKLFKRQAV